LSTSDDNEVCYVETKNLDGETNLKYQEANGVLHKKIKDGTKLSSLKYVCITKQPDEFIYKFDATVYETYSDGNIEDRNKYLLFNKKQFLLKG
jgi:hypothetical protein